MIKNYRSNNRKQHNNNNTKRKKTRARETLCNLSSDLHRSRQLFLLGSRLKIQKNSSGRVSRENSARSRSIGISSFRGGGQPEDRKLIDTFTAISRYRGIVLPCPRTPFLLFFHLSSFPPPPLFSLFFSFQLSTFDFRGGEGTRTIRFLHSLDRSPVSIPACIFL